MTRRAGIAALAVAAIAWSGAEARAARDLCDILKDKGTLSTDLEYNECKAAQEKKEHQIIATVQDFAKNWIAYKEGTGFVVNSASTAPQDYRNPTPKPRFSFALGNRLQARYTFLSPDGKGKDEDSTFRIRRFKTFFSGNAFYPWLKFKAQVNWVGFNEPDARTNEPDLEDAILDVAYFPFAALQVGQYKTPFDRQELTSSGALQFVDRAITHGRFTFGRDQGVMLHGLLGDEKYEWLDYGIGVFNGNGRNRSNNDNPDALGVGRIQVMPFAPRNGYFRYSESDVENTAKPSLAIGAGYGFNVVTSTSTTTSPPFLVDVTDPVTGEIDQRVHTTRTVNESDAEIHRLTADVHFKWRGLSLLGDYFYESRDDKELDTTRTELGEDGKAVSTTGATRQQAGTNAHGFNLQAGYFVWPRTIEVAARYAMFQPEGVSNRQEEFRGAVNWFVWAHNLKLQVDFGSVNKQVKGGEDTQDFEARTQLQLIF